MTITEAIKKRLEELNITQNELAAMIKTTKQNLNNKLSRDNFSAREIYDICKALNLNFKLTDTQDNNIVYDIEYKNNNDENSST